MKTTLALRLFAVAGLLAGPLLHAQQAPPSAAEQKLRENLRSTMLQLRTVENDKLILQATQAENEAKLKELTTKVETLIKQLGSEKDAADKLQADLQTKLAEQNRTVAELGQSLEKWKADHQRISEIATTKEAQRVKLAGEVVLLQRRVDDQQAKNATMYKVGSEVLTRYERFVLGDAIAAREPFTGIARVKFETLAQDFRDQLDDTRVTPQAPAKVAREKAAPEGARPVAQPRPAKKPATPAPPPAITKTTRTPPAAVRTARP